MEKDIMTIKDVAEFLSVSERTVYRLMEASGIQAFKVGGQWRFKREDVDKFIKQHYSRGAVMEEVDTAVPEESVKTVSVPLVGSASCGQLMLAEENIAEYIPVSSDLAKPPYKYFFLKAKGDSMNKAGINEGDLVLIRQQATAKNGERVVALVDDEATIKEFNLLGDTVVLKPKSTNTAHKPIILNRDFRIQGVVVAVIHGM